MSSLYTYDLPRMPQASGGQGSIYFGTRSDGLAVAVKVPTKGKRALEAIEREIQLLKAMEKHGTPGVVQCIDVITLDGVVAMVMPRFEGHLGTWLQQAIKKPDDSTLHTLFTHCARLARTLYAVHQIDYEGQRVIHRDVKPENIFLDKDGQVFLGDFGGAMAIDGLTQVELALFGTPMWAPLDQILPGQTIPDPTWDTYALCVFLYAGITGARPAYQADPRELLTGSGRDLWQLAREAIIASGEPRRTLKRTFARSRVGTKASDLVDFTGRAALNDADKHALFSGIDRLINTDECHADDIGRLKRGLWSLLVRGLSPLSHPSPPNRFRNGDELAQQLDDLIGLINVQPRPVTTPPPTPPSVFDGPMSGPDVFLDPISPSQSARRTSLSKTSPLFIGSVAVGLPLLFALLGWTGWSLWAFIRPTEAMILIPTQTVSIRRKSTVVPAFFIDRTEVSTTSWARCVQAKKCLHPAENNGIPDVPAVGIDLADALAYCAFRGGSLPTYKQWFAAAGPASWPWGEEKPTCDHAIALSCATEVQPSGSAPDGASAQGVVDLAGNAWEWVQLNDGNGLLVGGSLRSPSAQIGKKGKLQRPDGESWTLAGLRCAYETKSR